MVKIIVDFLSTQEGIILEYPISCIIILIIGIIIGWNFSYLLQKTKIETNEERLKKNEETLKGNEQILKQNEKDLERKDSEIESLKKQLESLNKDESVLSKDEVEALKRIRKFEGENPLQPPSLPAEYSVDKLVKDLEISWEEANEILKNLRRLGLFESVWDNVHLYPSLDQPINEARPGRLSQGGRDLVRELRNR